MSICIYCHEQHDTKDLGPLAVALCTKDESEAA